MEQPNAVYYKAMHFYLHNLRQMMTVRFVSFLCPHPSRRLHTNHVAERIFAMVVFMVSSNQRQKSLIQLALSAEVP